MKKILLDFGNVLCYPVTGNWFITPFFEQYIKDHEINKDLLMFNLVGDKEILDKQYKEMEEEVIMFYKYFTKVFNKINYDISDEDLTLIARDITYSTDKYQLYEGVKQELEELRKNYELYLLSDNWPCGEYLMHYWDISKHFEKLYISSYYGIKKDDKNFFKIPINEYNMDVKDITFIDDLDYPLETASSMGIKVLKMDRSNTLKFDKYNVIHDLKGL